MSSRWIGMKKRGAVIFIVSIVALVSCSQSQSDRIDATSPQNIAQDTWGEHGPKLDTIPIAELLTDFDPFLRQNQGLIDATIFLVKKYNPGLCYGMPSAVSDSLVAVVVAGSPQLAAFIRSTFAVESDFQVFTKIRQLLMTKVRKVSDRKYEYYLRDGRCCDILRFHGELELRDKDFFDRQLDRSVENVPC